MDLAFLALATFLALGLTPEGNRQALAWVSPQSPLVLINPEGSVLALPVLNVTRRGLDGVESPWRIRVGTGLIVLGLALVIGGLVWITSREMPTVPESPDETDVHSR